MKNLSDRLKFRRHQLGLKQAQIARAVQELRGRKFTQQAYAALESGSAKNSAEISAIAEVLTVPLEWLRDGKGPEPFGIDDFAHQLSASDDDIIHIPENGIIELDTLAGLGGGGELSVAYRRNGDIIEMRDAIKPEAWVFPEEFVNKRLRAKEADVIAIETLGDSMAPTIASGDRVFINTKHKIPSPDGIYAFRDRFNQIVVKSLKVPRDPQVSHVIVISDNPKYPAETMSLDDIVIIGRVVAILKPM